MAKSAKSARSAGETAEGAGSVGAGDKKNFEERLERLELLGETIRRSDIPLDEALSAFEEGIALAKTLEKDLAKIESRIEVLMNPPDAKAAERPELELFDSDSDTGDK